MSIILIEESDCGRLKGIKITNNCILSHLLFVDDVLIFLNGSVSDISVMNSALKLFYKAIGMTCNNTKSTITTLGCTPHEIHFVLQWFPFCSMIFEEGLKYLGFHLKPSNYKIVDWTWLIANIDKRLNTWHHRWLSQTNFLVLIKSFLEAIPVYLMSLAWIPEGIISRIQKICCGFLWNGSK